MPIRFLKKYAALEGVVSVEDAQNLLDWLKIQPDPSVKLEKCQHVHAAVLQVLLACRPRLIGNVANPWLANVLDIEPMPLKHD